MAISVFDLFKIGIGPSSSHTVGPMRAAKMFVDSLARRQLMTRVASVQTELYGSLGATGRGHGSDKAVLLGLMGETPEGVDVDSIERRLGEVRAGQKLVLKGDEGAAKIEREVAFVEREHLRFLRASLAYHPNGMKVIARDADGAEVLARAYYSVGGGFVVDENEATRAEGAVDEAGGVPLAFRSAAELLVRCEESKLSISGVMLANERSLRDERAVREGLLRIWAVMQQCVQRGCATDGVLPGGLKVKRRAADLYRQLLASPEAGLRDPLTALDWVTLYALAVNEENAAGGRVVTAPTNGAAGIIPAVLHYYARFVPGANDDGVVRFLLTAAAIGVLYKVNASISGAEVGCQGEVGSACSMAAGALCEVMGGTPEQVENAAEIAMEHNLGLTCDPIGGLVQVPCIERNAMASIKAIHAARMSLRGDGQHFVSLDKVIRTMRETGRDMRDKYKETARGGLALHVIEQALDERSEGASDLSVGLPEC
ncbi:MAG: L-serine ammonia-lyase [Myxococcales bacterium]|nr:L-serine ammonia-lyase [Myxococcales bacterium]